MHRTHRVQVTDFPSIYYPLYPIAHFLSRQLLCHLLTYDPSNHPSSNSSHVSYASVTHMAQHPPVASPLPPPSLQHQQQQQPQHQPQQPQPVRGNSSRGRQRSPGSGGGGGGIAAAAHYHVLARMEHAFVQVTNHD